MITILTLIISNQLLVTDIFFNQKLKLSSFLNLYKLKL